MEAGRDASRCTGLEAMDSARVGPPSNNPSMSGGRCAVTANVCFPGPDGAGPSTRTRPD